MVNKKPRGKTKIRPPELLSSEKALSQVCRERKTPSASQPSVHGQQTGVRWAKPMSCALSRACSANLWRAGI